MHFLTSLSVIAAAKSSPQSAVSSAATTAAAAATVVRSSNAVGGDGGDQASAVVKNLFGSLRQDSDEVETQDELKSLEDDDDDENVEEDINVVASSGDKAEDEKSKNQGLFSSKRAIKIPSSGCVWFWVIWPWRQQKLRANFINVTAARTLFDETRIEW